MDQITFKHSIDALEEKSKNVTTELAAISEALNDIDSSIASINASITTINAAITSLDARVTALEPEPEPTEE